MAGGHPVNFEPVPTVNPTGAPQGDFENIRAEPEMFGGLQAKATEKLGQDIEGVGNTIAEIQLRRQTELNGIHAADVNSWAADQITDKWSKYNQLQGRAALDALPQFKADVEDIRKQAITKVPSLQEQTQIAGSLRNLTDSYYRYGTNFADSQFRTYATRTANDAAENYANQAAIAAGQGDTKNFERNLHNQDMEIRNYWEHQGYDPQSIETEVTKKRGQTLKQIIETKADEDPNGASVMFQRYSYYMDPASRLAVMNKLKPILREQTNEINGAWAMGRSPPGEAFSIIEKQTGIPQGYISRTIQFESGGDPNARHGSHVGFVQGDATWNRRYGVTDPGNITQAANALIHEAQDNAAQLRPILGRNPNAAELYLAHQQGPGGVSALAENPGRPAWLAVRRFYGSDAVAQQAIWDNMSSSMKAQFPGGVSSVSSSDFMRVWEGRYARGGEMVGIIDKEAAYRRAQAAFGSDPIMFRGAISVINREYNYQETANATRRGELQSQIPGMIANVREGDLTQPLPPDVGLMGPVASARIQAEYASAYREGEARNSSQWASEEEIQDLRAGLAMGPGSDEFRHRDQRSFDNAIDARNKLIFGNPSTGKGADPVGYVQEHPIVSAMKKRLDERNPQTYSNYANAVLALQTHLGVQPGAQHVFSQQESQAMVSAITMPGANAKATLDHLEQIWGNHYPDVYHDLTTQGKLSPSYQLVGALDPKNADILSRWLQGTGPNEKGEAKTADEILGDAGGKSVASSIRQSTRSNVQLTDMQHSWADSGFSADQIKGLSSAVEDLAYAKSLYERADPATASNGAVEAIAGKYALWSGEGSARVPTEVNNVVRRNAAKTLADLKEGDLQLPTVYDAAPEGQSRIGWANSADYMRLLKATPYWITSPDGKGVMLKDSYLTGSLGRVVNDKSGKPIFIPFNAPLMEEAPNLPAVGASRDTPLGFAE